MIILLLLLALTSNAYAADITQEYRYQVLVKEEVNGIEYKDAIYYTPEEWQTLTQKEVNDEIEKRVTNFDNAIKNPPVQVEPTVEELQAQKAELQAQLTAQIADLDAKIQTKTEEALKVDVVAEEII